MVDYIGRFETLGDDFREVCTRIGIPHKELPKINTNKYQHYSQYFNNDTRKIIEQRFQKDIEIFDHYFEKQNILTSIFARISMHRAIFLECL
jgi:hypothetical protein